MLKTFFVCVQYWAAFDDSVLRAWLVYTMENVSGESGVGKSAIVRDLLGKISQTSGLATHGGTVLGRVLNYSERDTDILDNVSHLLAMSDSRDKGMILQIDLVGNQNYCISLN